ncbi:helix-turn-helix domain-containing protein [Solimonas flava]|uniref:helix-turn-helix domain-containing protein n=1 Tax=Solimonas flava TaxID=415849 RepID=UPI00042601CF|nr:helix-turn-helix domain-containing protein [Solimonas flava]
MGAPAPLPVLRFSTEGLREREAFDAWHDAAAVIFDTDRETPRRGFAAAITAYHAGEFVISDTRFGAQRFERPLRKLRADGLDHFLIQLYRRGGYAGRSGDDTLQVRPGELSVLDLSRPISTRASSAETVSLVIPRRLLEGCVDVDTLHGSVLSGARADLLGDYLTALLRRMPELACEDVASVVRATGELLAALLAPSADNVARARDPLRALTLERARRHIEQHLCSPQLGADTLCAALGISRATLYRLFDASGGVQAYIRKRRLQRVRDALLDPREQRHIATLAYAHGFASEAHFCRAFRRLFGLAPGELRQARHKTPDPRRHDAQAPDDGVRLQGWVHSLAEPAPPR